MIYFIILARLGCPLDKQNIINVIICTRTNMTIIPAMSKNASVIESLNIFIAIPPYAEKHITRKSIEASCLPTPYINIFFSDIGDTNILLTSHMEKKLVPELSPFNIIGMLIKCRRAR